MKKLLFMLTMFWACAFTSTAQATLLTFHVNLDGAQDNVPTPATGTALLTLDDIANTLDVSLTYAGLLSAATNAHIHCCALPGANAGVVIPFIPAGFATGGTSGSFAHTFTGLTPVLVADIESGLSYINIHTSLFPGGEIRGQIVLPEPATPSLMLAALAGMLWAGRRSPSAKRTAAKGLMPAQIKG
jgi:hypothetical protein